MRTPRRVVQKIHLTWRQRWILATYAFPGSCIWAYLTGASALLVLQSIHSFSGRALTGQDMVGLLVNLALMISALTLKPSLEVQAVAQNALVDLYHGYAFATTDRVVNVTDAGIEFSIAGMLYLQPQDWDVPCHGCSYALAYSPRTGIIWSITPQ